MQELFRKFATKISAVSGSSYTFIAAVLIVVAWWFSGPMFAYSDTWQLAINTGTTIVTFLMVFLIQNTQNRDGRAIQIKLDELIRATKGARNSLVNMEELSDDELAMLQADFQKLRAQRSSKMLAELHERILEERERRGFLGPIGTALKGAAAGITRFEQEVVNAVSPQQPPTATKKTATKFRKTTGTRKKTTKQ